MLDSDDGFSDYLLTRIESIVKSANWPYERSNGIDGLKIFQKDSFTLHAMLDKKEESLVFVGKIICDLPFNLMDRIQSNIHQVNANILQGEFRVNHNHLEFILDIHLKYTVITYKTLTNWISLPVCMVESHMQELVN
jgi:hypothetical protein